MSQQHFGFMEERIQESKQKRRAAAILETTWHQGEDFPMQVDMGIWGRLVKNWGMERLNDALVLYEGPPASLRMAYKRGNQHILQRLDAKARQEQDTKTPHISDGLKDFARKILDEPDAA